MQKLNEVHASKWKEFKDLLILDWEDYFANISESVVSIHYCICLLCLCERYEPKSVIDLGSGFTSYALRRYREAYDKDLEIHTVDSDPYWLSNSCSYCQEKSLSDEYFYLWKEFKDEKIRADLVSIDIDSSGARKGYFREAFEMARKHALLDDMHKARINKPVHVSLKAMNRGYEYINLKHLTHDKWGRFAVLISLEEL